MNENASYLLINKKYFSRYVLAYEVIPSWLCAKVNQSLLLNDIEAQSVVNSGLVEQGYLLLELTMQGEKNAYSLATLSKVWFLNEELKQKFLDNSYENFDVKLLNCVVVEQRSANTNPVDLDIEPAKEIRKSDFVNMMMLEDGIMAMFYNRIKKKPQVEELSLITEPYYSKNELLRELFHLDSKNEIETAVRNSFIELCLDFGIDAGWDAIRILDQLTDSLPEDISSQSTYIKWKNLALDFINSEVVPSKLFTDDGSIVLRAIILVLLNPRLDSLKALKEQNAFEVGSEVYRTAQVFTLLRLGYSSLNAGQRAEIGDDRVWLQNFNAALHNGNFKDLLSQVTIKIDLPNDVTSVEDLAPQHFGRDFSIKFDFLSLSQVRLAAYQVFDIEGIVPNSGFKMSLLTNDETSQVSMWIIDLRTDIGEKKYKGKLALDLLKIQSNFDGSIRFEVDDNGVYLMLNSSFSDSSDLKENLKQLFNQLSLLKVLNTRKTTFI
jgi:hypothetical protein